jgi:flagellin-like hook-associated protein FlgL
MTGITAYGAYARNTSLIRTITQGQRRVDDLSTQLQSGVKSNNLADIGSETQRLLDLRTQLVQRQAHISSIDTALSRTKAQDLVLEQLSSMASDLISTSSLPIDPGRPSVEAPKNADQSKMKISINTEMSQFTQNTTYTVTAVPSATGGNGNFDITVHDGLGGRATTTLTIADVPPEDGYNHTFKIGGGPGEGSVLSINFDTLTSASSSSFAVSYPDTRTTRERVEKSLDQVQALLNERFGDRYLFAGSRYEQPPVKSLTDTHQVTKITLDGQLGRTNDRYELDVAGRRFTYLSDGTETDFQEIAQSLTDSINTADPALPLIATSTNGVITLTAKKVGEEIPVSSRFRSLPSTLNSFGTPTHTQTATVTRPQITNIELRGNEVDIGDTFKLKLTVGDPNDPYNQRYYEQNPTAPRTRPLYQEMEVAYTVTEQDYRNPTSPVTDVNGVADKLRAQISAVRPAWPATPDALGSGETIVLTGTTDDVPFTIEPSVINGEVPNTITISTLPAEPVPPKISTDSVKEPALPFYDSDRDRYHNRPEAWDRAKVTYDDKRVMNYGIVSTDPAFQELIAGVRYARAAIDNPGKYTEYMEQARNLLVKARDDIRQVSAKNASDQATLETTKQSHEDAKASVAERIASIEQIDQTEVTARLRTAVTTLEATYTVVGRTQQLSLINYLS